MLRGMLIAAVACVATLAWTVGNAGFAEEASGEPIVIGSPVPLTGYYAGDGEHMKNAITLAVEDLNAKGGVLGRPVEVTFFDIEDMTPESLTAAAQQLVVRDKVNAVLAGYAGMGPDVAAFGRYDTIFVHNDATANTAQMVMENYEQFSNVFMMSWWAEEPWGVEDWAAISTYPVDHANKKLAIIRSEFEWDIKLSSAFADSAKRDGWEIVIEETVPWDATEWGPILAKIRDEQPSIIYFSSMIPDSIVSFARQFRENPTDSLVALGVSIWWTGVVEALGEDGNGMLGWVTQEPLPTESDPHGMELVEKYRERFDKDPEASWVFAYDVVGLWAAAAERAGTVDDQAAIAESMLAEPYFGYGGRYKFEADHGNAVRPSAYQPNFHGQIQDGRFVPIYITKEQNPEEGMAAVKPYPYAGAGEFRTPPWME